MRFSKHNEQDNFWVSYADLMAGLLFVFILLVGGIIIKYVFTQNSLNEKEKDFLSTVKLLEDEKTKTSQLEEVNKIFADRLKNLQIESDSLKDKNSIYVLQISELEKIKEELDKKNSDLNLYIADLEEKRKNELEESNKKDTELSDNKIKIAYLLEEITKKDKDLNQILNDLNTTKTRIKALAGVKIEIISDIKKELGENVNIDPETGALTLSSSVLFDKGSSILKDEIKPQLKAALQKYFSILMNNQNIRENLDSINIEGYTDTDGGYIYNLELSQQRAFSVMDFINSWNTDNRLRKYLVASGRSFMSPIMKNGKEDKDASRRIEIKFSVSNKNTINEIQRFLNYDANKTDTNASR